MLTKALLAYAAAVGALGVCRQASGLGPAASPIDISGFSGRETLVSFGGFSSVADSLIVDGVRLLDETEGFLVLQEGGQIPDVFFGNIPGASKGGYGKTTATLLLQILVDLPARANRFGMLVSTGGPVSYEVTAYRDGAPLGSVLATQPGNSQAVFAGIQTRRPFEQIRITQVGHSGMTSAFDDLRFELIPEPSTCVIVSTAAVAVAGMRRGRRGPPPAASLGT
jgi:hypothetical protein